MRRFVLTALLGFAGCVAACERHEFEPPDREARVRAAAASYTPALFDTLVWGSEEEWSYLGNEVYVEQCRTCHGPLGRGATDYAREQGMQVPSLVEAEWRLADPDSLRRTIFVGHPSGMPVFGDHDLTPRQIDAVARYVLDVLRPDVLGSGAR